MSLTVYTCSGGYMLWEKCDVKKNARRVGLRGAKLFVQLCYRISSMKRSRKP